MRSGARTTTDGPRSVLDLRRPPTSPGEMLLEEFLRPASLTQVEAARRMKIPLNRLNEVIRGRRGITADTALRLARLFKMSPEFWMDLQADWDLWHAAYALRKARQSPLPRGVDVAAGRRIPAAQTRGRKGAPHETGS